MKGFEENAAVFEKECLMKAIEARRPLAEVSRLYVSYVLAGFSCNKVWTARALRVDRRTIQRWERTGAWPGRPSRRPEPSPQAQLEMPGC